MVGWLVGCSVGRSVGRSFGWLVGWFGSAILIRQKAYVIYRVLELLELILYSVIFSWTAFLMKVVQLHVPKRRCVTINLRCVTSQESEDLKLNVFLSVSESLLYMVCLHCFSKGKILRGSTPQGQVLSFTYLYL